MMIMKKLLELVNKHSGKAYITGECVRHILKKEQIQDIEVVVVGVSFSEILNKLEDHSPKIIHKKGMLNVVAENNISIYIRLPMNGDNYVNVFIPTQDAEHNNFSINTIYIPICENLDCVRISKEIIDPFNGVSDINKRLIKCVKNPGELISKDPIKMLYAFAVAASLNYRVDTNIIHNTKIQSHNINRCDINDIRELLIKIIMSKKSSRYFLYMYQAGLLHELLPELAACYGVSQNKQYHKHDVFMHCILSGEAAEPILVVKLAALLHDIGKPKTRKESNKKVTFYNHEVVGAKLTKNILRRLGFNSNIVKEVSELVYLHMYNYEPSQWTDTAVRRFIKKTNITRDNIPSHRLFLVRKAERLSHNNTKHAVSLRQQELENRIKEIMDIDNKQDPILAINGNDIIRIFHVSQGPLVGRTLKYLSNMVIENIALNNKITLLSLASDYIIGNSDEI